jgi:HEPN domain-containing protein
MAGQELAAARVLANAPGIDPAIPGYHAQQAAEKALKAILIHAGREVSRTHELGRLHELVADTGVESLPTKDDLDWLTLAGLGGRYPDSATTVELVADEAKTAIDLAAEIVATARRILGAE